MRRERSCKTVQSFFRTSSFLPQITTPDNNDEENSWSDIASRIPDLVWDNGSDLLLEKHRADAVHTEHQVLKLDGLALAPHSDGHMWGDNFPNLVILACEEPADNHGGANFLIDGYSVLDELSESTRTVLENELVDHTERGEYGDIQGMESIIPVFRYLPFKGWRSNDSLHDGDHKTKLCWRRMVTNDAATVVANAKASGSPLPYTSLWVPPPNVPSSEEHARTLTNALYELDQVIMSVEHKAPRFTLKKGDALIVDNFRMLHGRDGFLGSEKKRRMWRVWSWTNESLGLPSDIKPSGEGVPANILEKTSSTQHPNV